MRIKNALPLLVSRNCKLFFISFVLVWSTMPMISYATEQSDLRGKRYCEIILVKSKDNVAVYNSFGLNDCPEAIWEKISVSQIEKETGAILVRLNGPRYWVIDGFENTTILNPTIKTIDGLAVRQWGELVLDENDFFLVNIPYNERTVKRHTTWIFEAGKPVYELIDTKGHLFIMHSYCTQLAPLTEKSLNQLGNQLKLPPGWRFKSGILKKTRTLTTVHETTVVVRDNLMNDYQQIPDDFLK